MKPPMLTLLVLLMQQALAQLPGNPCMVLSVSSGFFFPRHPGSNVAVSFPYTTTPNATGVTTNQQFSGSLGNIFLRTDFIGDLEAFEVSIKHHAINGWFGLVNENSRQASGYFRGGYSHVFHFHGGRIRFQIGADLYAIIGSPDEMGRIDNKDQTLQLFGHTASPSWSETYTSYSRYGPSQSHTVTYYADHLSVLYRRSAFLFAPKAALSVTKKRCVLGLETGWMFQLSQICHLTLQQYDADNNDYNTIAEFPEPSNGTISGPYLTFRIGYIALPRHYHP